MLCPSTFFATAYFALHVAWCTLFFALFGGNLCESIALTIPPSFPSFLYFFTVDSSSSSDSEKESLGDDVDEEEEKKEEEEEEEEMGSILEDMALTPKRHRLADTPVARLQPEGVLRYQSVPTILPAYKKFMCGLWSS